MTNVPIVYRLIRWYNQNGSNSWLEQGVVGGKNKIKHLSLSDPSLKSIQCERWNTPPIKTGNLSHFVFHVPTTSPLHPSFEAASNFPHFAPAFCASLCIPSFLLVFTRWQNTSLSLGQLLISETGGGSRGKVAWCILSMLISGDTEGALLSCEQSCVHRDFKFLI